MATNRERLKELTDRLEAGILELFSSDRYAEYLKVMSQFTHYSVNNTMLIALQKPEATLVAGYQAWEKKFKRHVMKGEKGIRIISPAPHRQTREQEKKDPATGAVLMGPDGNPETEEVTVTIPRFVPAVVFDISQTDGEPLPDLGAEELTASVENYEVFMKAIRSVAPVPLRFADISGSAKGYYDNVNKEIVIRTGMSESQTMKTAVHETVHALLHDRDVMKEQGIRKDRQTAEVEAESCAFVVCAHFELDTSDYSFPYIAGWSSSREAKELKASMNTIRRTAGEVIDGIEESMKEQFREKHEELDKEQRENTEKPDSEKAEEKRQESTLSAAKDLFMIYQLNDDETGIRLKFENMDHLQKHGIPVDPENYHLVYRGELKEGDTLDGIYERFNLDHPKDFRGHSLSVSDVVVLSHGGEKEAYFVDSIGFKELEGFVSHETEQDHRPLSAASPAVSVADEREGHQNQYENVGRSLTDAFPAQQAYDQCAYETPDGYFSIQTTEGGYDYSFYDRDYKLLDGGVLTDEPGKEPRSIDQAVEELFKGNNLSAESCREISYDELIDHTDDANQPPAETEIERLARDIDDFLHDYDTYEYWDRVEDREQNVTEIMNDLNQGATSPIREYLEMAMKEGAHPETASLLQRLEQFEPHKDTPAEKEPLHSFFVAECMEFPVMGEYHDHLTLTQAAEIYESIPSDRMHGVKGIGIDLDDGSSYSGSIDLMQGGRVDKEVINSIDHYRESPFVQQALQELADYYPDREQAVENAVVKIRPLQEVSKVSQERDQDKDGQPGSGRKESVLQALKEHQAKVKTLNEPEKDNKQKEKKKGELTI